MTTDKSQILVSICCLSFNHAMFIRKALDGFLMQEPPSCMPKDAKLSDWCEILIHDDCSTDGTTEIVREYAAKYPDVIFPLYEEMNQFTRGGKGRMDLYNYERARGKYMATCEGDDYWTDAQKLQKQVDFMDTHLEYSVCFHRVMHYYFKSGDYREDICGQILGDNEGVDITPDIFFKAWYTQPLSMLFRTSMFDFSWRSMYKYYRDSYEIYHLLKAGKGYLFAFVGGIYNRHQGGIASAINNEKRFSESYEVANELYKINRDQYTKDYLVSTLQWIVDWDGHTNKRTKLLYIHQILWLSGDVMRYLRNIRNLMT